MQAKIVHVEQDNDGTFGVFVLDNNAFCVTLERPDVNNAPKISCIPNGVYTCERVKSPLVLRLTTAAHKGNSSLSIWDNTFEIKNIPNRSRVLFHSGNVVGDTEGCILLAQYFGKLKGNRAVLNSGVTFEGFMQYTKNINSFSLKIFNALG